jgi:hypothetical protein
LPELTERRPTGHYVWFVHPMQLALGGLAALWLLVSMIGAAEEPPEPAHRLEQSCRVTVMNGGQC